MVAIEMPAITFKHPTHARPVLIPGGWNAMIPRIMSVDLAAERAYMAYWMPDAEVRHDAARARARAYAGFQHVLESGWKRLLRASIVRWAKVYMERNPQLARLEEVQGYGMVWILHGFDPEQAQTLWAPSENVGKAGKPASQEVIREMAITERSKRRSRL